MISHAAARKTLLTALERSPIIAAVKSEEQLEHCLESECTVVFLLFGNVCNIASLVEKVKNADKLAFVHMEFIDGLAPREISVQFIRQFTKADGILTTKQQLIRCAKEQGLIAVQRFFMIDSIAFSNVQKQLHAGDADFIEILPAVLPKILKGICEGTHIPVIASGMIVDKEDVLLSLNCGAAGISSTNPNVWFM